MGKFVEILGKNEVWHDPMATLDGLGERQIRVTHRGDARCCRKRRPHGSGSVDLRVRLG